MERTIWFPQVDAETGKIEVYAEQGEMTCSIFTVNFDDEGGRYQTTELLDKDQLKELIDILTEAYNVIKDSY